MPTSSASHTPSRNRPATRVPDPAAGSPRPAGSGRASQPRLAQQPFSLARSCSRPRKLVSGAGRLCRAGSGGAGTSCRGTPAPAGAVLPRFQPQLCGQHVPGPPVGRQRVSLPVGRYSAKTSSRYTSSRSGYSATRPSSSPVTSACSPSVMSASIRPSTPPAATPPAGPPPAPRAPRRTHSSARPRHNPSACRKRPAAAPPHPRREPPAPHRPAAQTGPRPRGRK